MTSTLPLTVVRFAFYAFIFAIPIETLDIGIESGLLSVSSLIGYLFIMVALVQPTVTFGELPRPFWYFVAYLCVFACLGFLQIPEYWSSKLVMRILTVIQLLALFLISYNLFQHQQVIKGAWLAFSAGCVLLSILQIGGIAAKVVAKNRLSTLSQDPNSLGSQLGLGLLVLLGLAYGRNSQDIRISWLVWMCSGSLAAGMMLSGSRGALLSLVLGIMCLAARPGHATLRLKVGFIAVLTICSLVWAAYENDVVRTRWEKTYSAGNLAGREEIMPAAWSMFIESPIVGWGPVINVTELGYRFGRPFMDTHNGYLWILTETGLAGGVPYLIALWLCLRAAWRARHGPEGSLPLALLTSVFLINMSITWHYRKMFWIILAYSVASESFLSKRWRLDYPAGSIEKTPHPVGYGLH
jgi:O-antigen ligase